jgi:hypothetical protein
MSFLKSWFADRPPPPAPPTEAIVAPESIPVHLPALIEGLRDVLADLEPSTLDADVVRAKLADVCRGFSLEPLDPLELDHLAAGFDRGAWERMGVLVLAMERGAVGEGLRRALSGRVRGAVRGGLIEAAQGSPLLTLDLLRSAPLRLEELARRFVLGLGASIAGESVEASRKALERLDYGRLMAEADRAKRVAADKAGRRT